MRVLVLYQLVAAPSLLAASLGLWAVLRWDWTTGLTSVVGVLVLFGVAFYGSIFVTYQLYRHNERDAARVWKSLAVGDKPFFILFLRDFDDDRGWVDLHTGRPWWWPGSGLVEPPLALALRKLAPVIGLMRDPEIEDEWTERLKWKELAWSDGHLQGFGVGRIPTATEEWSSSFDALLEAATAVLVMPGLAATSESGLRAELATLRDSDALRKAVFFQPPQSHPRFTAEKWLEIANSLRGAGIRLPEPRQRGQMFCLDRSGRPCCVAPVALWSHLLVRRTFKRLLASAGTPWPRS